MSSEITNPLQGIIDQFAEAGDSGQIKAITKRQAPGKRQKVSQERVLVVDTSGSMGEWVGGRRKIDILHQAVEALAQTGALAGYRLLAFASDTAWLATLGDVDPSGGTNLELALMVVAALRPQQTLVVSDGIPDDRGAALRAARSVTGTIDTLYIGPDSNTEAIAFMRDLARVGCGRVEVCDISRLEQQPRLGGAIAGLLPGAE